MTGWKVDASRGEAGPYPVAFVLCAPCERYIVEQNRNAECGGGNGCPRAVNRHTRRRLSVETWLLWMLAATVLWPLGQLAAKPVSFPEVWILTMSYSRLKSVGLGHLFPEQGSLGPVILSSSCNFSTFEF